LKLRVLLGIHICFDPVASNYRKISKIYPAQEVMIGYDSTALVGSNMAAIEDTFINNGREETVVYQGSRLRQTPIYCDRVLK